MNADAKVTLNLGKLALVIAVITGAAGLISAAVLIPHRLERLEQQVNVIATDQAKDHELLSRIDERTAAFERRLGTRATVQIGEY